MVSYRALLRGVEVAAVAVARAGRRSGEDGFGKSRPHPGVDILRESRRARDEVLPGRRGGPEGRVTCKAIHYVRRVGLEDEDRLVAGEKDVVALETCFLGVERGSLLEEPRSTVASSFFQRKDDDDSAQGSVLSEV